MSDPMKKLEEQQLKERVEQSKRHKEENDAQSQRHHSENVKMEQRHHNERNQTSGGDDALLNG